jgi:putative acetyltransferase
MEVTVEPADRSDPEARALLRAGHDLMQALFPGSRRPAFSEASPFAGNIRIFIARMDEVAVGCCVLILQESYAELKNMYVMPQARRNGVANLLIQHAELYAKQNGSKTLKLESGSLLVDAHRLYARCGFSCSEVFGDHADSPTSVFLEKRL